MDIFSRVRDCDFLFLRGVPELVMIPLYADDVPAVLLKYFYEFSGTISFPDDFPSIVTPPIMPRSYTRASPSWFCADTSNVPLGVR